MLFSIVATACVVAQNTPAAGSYGGMPLGDWKRRLQQPVPTVANLLGKSFRQRPENQSYPLAGNFVEALVDKLGLAKVRNHLYAACYAGPYRKVIW